MDERDREDIRAKERDREAIRALDPKAFDEFATMGYDGLHALIRLYTIVMEQNRTWIQMLGFLVADLVAEENAKADEAEATQEGSST